MGSLKWMGTAPKLRPLVLDKKPRHTTLISIKKNEWVGWVLVSLKAKLAVWVHRTDVLFYLDTTYRLGKFVNRLV